MTGIEDTRPGPLEQVGGSQRTTGGSSTVCWVLRSGARWHDLPERYGKPLHARFMDTARAGRGGSGIGYHTSDTGNSCPAPRAAARLRSTPITLNAPPLAFSCHGRPRLSFRAPIPPRADVVQ